MGTLWESELEEFVVLYGSECDYVNNCKASKFDYIFEADEIVNRTHSDIYNFIFKHTSGSFKQLSFYKKYKSSIGDDFESFFYDIVDYFNSNGINILNTFKIHFFKRIAIHWSWEAWEKI